jgi:formylglycine-generating enzyme required for sulfatase activity
MSKIMFFALVATATLNFVSCGNDDEDDNGSGNNPNPNPSVVTQDYTVNGITFKMITVKAGTFTMGASNADSAASDREKPAHQVTLTNDYLMGQTEVTQELWQTVMGSNPSYFTGEANLPVETVSWEDAQEFITRLNQLTGKTFRLPTEAEWEYAARGGNRSQGYLYSGSNNIDNVAWFNSNSGSKTHAVGTKQANELGIYDMSGNVWEWVNDWYGAYSSESQTNPQGASTGSYRVGRGGSWGNGAAGVRVSARISVSPGDRGSGLGFRLACSSN